MVTNPNLISDLVAIAMGISIDDGEQMVELKDLILQLPGTAKAEREVANKRINAVVKEREEANMHVKVLTKERDQATEKLRIAEEEVKRLRVEVEALENRSRETNSVKRKGGADEAVPSEEARAQRLDSKAGRELEAAGELLPLPLRPSSSQSSV